MTAYQEKLLNQAKDYWQNGYQVPIDLYSLMASEGMDVPRLEQKHYEDQE